MPFLLRADEKYNFERLQRTTVLNKQPLLVPQPLELSPTEELTVRCGRVPILPLLMLPPLPCPVPLYRDNLEVFRQNGFYFKDDPANGRLLLAAVPFRCSSMLPPVGQL